MGADPNAVRIREAIGDWVMTLRIWPETDIAAIRRRLTGRSGTEVVEYLSKTLAGRVKKPSR